MFLLFGEMFDTKPPPQPTTKKPRSQQW